MSDGLDETGDNGDCDEQRCTRRCWVVRLPFMLSSEVSNSSRVGSAVLTVDCPMVVMEPVKRSKISFACSPHTEFSSQFDGLGH